MRREEPFNLLVWPAADEGEPVADRGVFGLLRALSRGSSEALTSAWLSTTMSRPPGRSTRIHSSIARSGCGNVHNRCRLTAISKLAAAKGSSSASASS